MPRCSAKNFRYMNSCNVLWDVCPCFIAEETQGGGKYIYWQDIFFVCSFSSSWPRSCWDSRCVSLGLKRQPLGHWLKNSCAFTFAAAAAAKSLQSCPTLWPHRRQPTRLPRPWDSPGKNTGVGCHCLLRCMKVKSESEVTQSCPTPNDPMDCSPPGSSVHGIFQSRGLEWGAIAFSGIYLYLPTKL